MKRETKAVAHSATAAARLGSAVPGRGSCHGNPTTPESFVLSLLSVRISRNPSSCSLLPRRVTGRRTRDADADTDTNERGACSAPFSLFQLPTFQSSFAPLPPKPPLYRPSSPILMTLEPTPTGDLRANGIRMPVRKWWGNRYIPRFRGTFTNTWDTWRYRYFLLTRKVTGPITPDMPHDYCPFFINGIIISRFFISSFLG